jgi:hypothetical protein
MSAHLQAAPKPAPRPPRPTPPKPVDIRTINALAWLTEPEHRRWVCWRYDLVDGKWSKVPYTPYEKNQKARSNDPATWADYETAWTAVRRGIYDGVGVMLHGLAGEFFAAIDLDDVRDPATGALLPWAQALVEARSSYCEVTPSGEGIRILGNADGTDAIHTRGNHPEGGSFELFVCCNRYITVSGRIINEDCAELRDISAQIEALAKLGKLEPRSKSNGRDGPHQTIRLEDLSAKICDLVVSATVDGKPVDHPGAKLLEVSNYLKKRGFSFEASLALLAVHPDGVASKFIRENRLEKEFRRAWEKGEAPDPEPSKVGRILTGADFIASFTPPDWLIDGVVQRGRLYACTSLTGHGKTAVWSFNGCMIQTGGTIGSLDVCQGNALYLAGENPEDLKARLHGMVRAFNLPHERLPYVLPGNFPLVEEEADRLKREIAALGVPLALILGDTASSFFPGDDENDNVQAGAYARTLRRFTECGGNPTVVALCHPTKNASRNNLLPRGGGAFLNELDGNLTLWSDSPGELSELHWCGKIRGPDFAPLGYRLRPMQTGFADRRDRPVMTIVAEPMSEEAVADHSKQALANETAVLKTMHDKPDWSWAQIARHLDWVDDADQPEKWRVGRALQALAEDGLIERRRKKEKWRLTEKGGKALNPPAEKKGKKADE